MMVVIQWTRKAGRMERDKYLAISDLEKKTGIAKSTIRYYIHEGLLSPYIKTGKTMAYYTEEDVRKLQLIRNLREEGKVPLKFVKEELNNIEAEKGTQKDQTKSIDRRQEIIETTSRLFTQKGYDKVSIQDIVGELQMSKSTFYVYFANKEELFMECADHIFHQMFNHVWESIRQEKDVIARLRKRAEAFIEVYPTWRDMMNQLRGIAVKDHPEFMDKYKSSLSYIVKYTIKDIETAVEQGLLKDVNPEILGYGLTGLTEYIAELHYLFGKYSKAEVFEQITNILDGTFHHIRLST
jgi:AcrR family transcriptional regulator/predicted DNA-binding transcriptional regulator AlpA